MMKQFKRKRNAKVFVRELIQLLTDPQAYRALAECVSGYRPAPQLTSIETGDHDGRERGCTWWGGADGFSDLYA